MATEREAPSPTPDPEVAAFGEAAARDRLVLPRCASCGKLHWYPRGTCPFCLSTDIEWQDSPGFGQVYSVTLFHRGGGDVAIAYVELDEGLRLLTNVLSDDPASISIGQRVVAVLVPSAEEPYQRLPFFRPVADADGVSAFPP